VECLLSIWSHRPRGFEPLQIRILYIDFKNVYLMVSFNLELLLPEIFLAIALSALLVYGVTMSTTIVRVEGSSQTSSPLVQQNIISLSIFTLLIGAGMLISIGWPTSPKLRCDGVLIFDGAAVVVKTLIIIRTAVTLWMSYEYRKEEQMRIFEFAILILMASLGLCLLVSAYDLIALYIALELQSLCLYALAAMRRTSIYSTEAGLKYFVLGAVSSGLRLYGMSLIYGWTGTTQFGDRALVLAEGSMPTTFNIGVVLLRVGLFFKVGVVPFHQFVPDVYEGAPTVVTAFFAIVPKAAVRVVLSRLLGFVFYDVVDSWSTLVMLCSLASMVVAAFAALSQRRRKRFFAYSSIGHVGYMMMGFASGSVEGIQGIILYLFVYSVMSIYVWTFILSLEHQRGGRALYFTDLAGLGMHHPILALGFAIVIFSIAGVPPLAGFLAKMFVFFSAIESGLYLLAVVGVLSSCVGAFYYIRFIKIMYFETPHTFFMYQPIPLGKSLLMAGSLAFVLLFIVDPQFRVTLSRSVALVICSA
jgi:NADH-quinone oxidoreductase subunit N